MTYAKLEKLVADMLDASGGRVRPTQLELTEEANPFDLYWLLTKSPCLTRIETPEHSASRDEKGNVFIIRRGSIAYSDGI